MSKIEELLKNEKVEWIKLGHVCKFPRGQSITKKDIIEGDIPVVAGGQKPAYYHNVSNREGITIVVAGSGAYAGFVSFWDIPIFVSDAFSVEPDSILEKRYVYHWLLSKQKKIYELKRGCGIPHVYGESLGELLVPIPSPETQKKIVEILDNFTDYVMELQAELQNRTKQYEYYRNMLLSEEYLNKLSDKLGILPMEAENQLRCTTLGEIGKICMCKRILKEETLPKGDVPFYKIGTFGKKADAFIRREVFDEYKEKYSYPREGEVLISCSGTIGRTVIFDGKDAYFQDSNIIWLSHDESIVLNKYLFYFCQNAKWNATSGGTISRLYTYNLVNLNIELPSLLLQNKIVEILDRFQSMLSDTKGLLPKEIEQRRKQYEYYREKLLTFDMESDSKQASKQAR